MLGDLPMIVVQDAKKNAIALTYSYSNYLVKSDPSSEPQIGDTVFIFSMTARVSTRMPYLKGSLIAQGPFIILNDGKGKEQSEEHFAVNIDYTSIDWSDLLDAIPVMSPKEAIDIITRRKMDDSQEWTYRKILNVEIKDVTSVFRITNASGRIVEEHWTGEGVVDPISGNLRDLSDTDKVKYFFKGSLVVKGGGTLKVNGWNDICKLFFDDRSARQQFVRKDARKILEQYGNHTFNAIVSKWEARGNIGFTLERVFYTQEEQNEQVPPEMYETVYED